MPQVEDRLDAARNRGLLLFPCLIHPALRKSYLSLKMEVPIS
jgi:hypothetical protein